MTKIAEIIDELHVIQRYAAFEFSDDAAESVAVPFPILADEEEVAAELTVHVLDEFLLEVLGVVFHGVEAEA